MEKPADKKKKKPGLLSPESQRLGLGAGTTKNSPPASAPPPTPTMGLPPMPNIAEMAQEDRRRETEDPDFRKRRQRRLGFG